MKYFLLLPLAMMTCAAAQAETGHVDIDVGAERTTQKLDVSGVLLGSLVPETDFGTSSRDHDVSPYVAVAYEQPVGSGFFVGAEFNATLGSSRQVFSTASSAQVVQTIEICVPPPPPVPPQFCTIFLNSRTFSETQALDFSVRTGPAVSLSAKVGLSRGPFSAWISGGPAVQRIRASYTLPAVNTVEGPVPPFISLPFPPDVTGSLPPSVVLPEESRIAKLSPSGWTIGAGLRARVSKNMSITGSYAWTDFGTAKLAPTQRLGPVKIESKIEAWRLTLGYRF